MANKIPRVPVREQDPAIRATNFEEVCYGYDLEEATLEASRCLRCKNPRCVAACPVGIRIPDFIAALHEGRLQEAADIISEDSSLPSICGRVCPQESQCEGSCILGIKSEPVAVGKLERFVGDWKLEHGAPVQPAAVRNGRKVAVTGRSMENILKVATELDYLHLPENTLVDLNQIKSIPKDKLVIVSTGSQGEDMSALYRMAFSSHRQVEIQPGDHIIISASAIPGNEKSISRIINELYRKGAEVIYDKLEGLHVSGHACQEELKIIHALTKPKFFIPVHGEQRHLQKHAALARQMGMNPKNILIADTGSVIECTPKTCKLAGTVPAGKILVDGTGVGDVGSVVLRDRKHLAQDGMIVVCVNLSSEDGSVLSGPDIISRGFVYMKDNEDLMDAMKMIATHSLEVCHNRNISDWATIKSTIKGDLSQFLFKNTKRNPMILPVIMEI